MQTLLYRSQERRPTYSSLSLIIEQLDHQLIQKLVNSKEIGLNDIGRITIRTTKPLFYDSYTRNRNTGSLILIDEATNETVGAGMII